MQQYIFILVLLTVSTSYSSDNDQDVQKKSRIPKAVNTRLTKPSTAKKLIMCKYCGEHDCHNIYNQLDQHADDLADLFETKIPTAQQDAKVLAAALQQVSVQPNQQKPATAASDDMEA